jgi:hypothetical protein
MFGETPRNYQKKEVSPAASAANSKQKEKRSRSRQELALFNYDHTTGC